MEWERRSVCDGRRRQQSAELEQSPRVRFFASMVAGWVADCICE